MLMMVALVPCHCNQTSSFSCLAQQSTLQPFHGVDLCHGTFPILHATELPSCSFYCIQSSITFRSDLVHIGEGARAEYAEIVKVREGYDRVGIDVDGKTSSFSRWLSG